VRASEQEAGTARDACSACVLTTAQTATLVVDKHGLLVYTYDDSRTMQGCAHFRREARRESERAR